VTNPYGKSVKIHLKPEKFNQTIWDQGIRVSHEKTAVCPNCFDTKSAHYDINCSICENGKIHYSSTEVWVLFYQKKLEELFQLQGIWNPGDVISTFPSVYEDGEVIRVDFGDRITLLDFEERTSDLITRAESGDTDSPRYEVKDVEYLRTATTVYEKDTHYSIVDGDIKWLGSIKPQSGEVYTLAYKYPPVFRVINFFHEQRYYYDSFKQAEGAKIPTYMPVQAQLRRDYIIDSRKNYD